MLTLCRDGAPCCVSHVPNVRVQKRLWFLPKVQVFPLYMCVLLRLQVWDQGPFPELGTSRWLAPVGQACTAVCGVGVMVHGAVCVAVPARRSRTASLRPQRRVCSALLL